MWAVDRLNFARAAIQNAAAITSHTHDEGSGTSQTPGQHQHTQQQSTARRPMRIKSTHNLLTETWTDDVYVVEEAIGHLGSGRAGTNDCQVALFEIVHDDHLHVNVTHKYATRTMPGWAGPAVLRNGFVHNRTFGDTRPADIIRHIRQMVLAARN